MTKPENSAPDSPLRAIPGAGAKPSAEDDRFASTGPLSIRRSQDDEACVLSLFGELDMGSVDTLELELRRAQAGKLAHIVLDLSGLEFLDSTGLRTILNAVRRMQEHGKQLTLLRGPRQVHRVFELTGLDTTLPFDDQVA